MHKLHGRRTHAARNRQVEASSWALTALAGRIHLVEHDHAGDARLVASNGLAQRKAPSARADDLRSLRHAGPVIQRCRAWRSVSRVRLARPACQKSLRGRNTTRASRSPALTTKGDLRDTAGRQLLRGVRFLQLHVMPLPSPRPLLRLPATCAATPDNGAIHRFIRASKTARLGGRVDELARLQSARLHSAPMAVPARPLHWPASKPPGIAS